MRFTKMVTTKNYFMPSCYQKRISIFESCANKKVESFSKFILIIYYPLMRSNFCCESIKVFLIVIEFQIFLYPVQKSTII